MDSKLIACEIKSKQYKALIKLRVYFMYRRETLVLKDPELLFLRSFPERINVRVKKLENGKLHIICTDLQILVFKA